MQLQKDEKTGKYMCVWGKVYKGRREKVVLDFFPISHVVKHFGVCYTKNIINLSLVCLIVCDV